MASSITPTPPVSPGYGTVTVNSTGIIPAAAGYRGQQGNYPSIYDGKPILFFYGATVAGRITTQNTVGSVIKETGAEVVFWRSSTATVRPYSRAQRLNGDTLSAPTITLRINLAYYANMNVDVIDRRQNALFDQLLESWQVDAMQKMAQISDVDTFSAMEFQSSSLNKGSCAGQTSFSYDMGSAGAPVELSPDNILEVLQDCNNVLIEANAPDGDLFIVLPPPLNGLLAKSQVLSQAWSSGEARSSYLNGATEIKGPISGFGDVLISNYLQRRFDPDAGVYCYAIPFGPKNATAFITQTSLVEIVPQRPDDFGQSARMLQSYGIRVLTPEVMGVLYATVAKPTTTPPKS